MISEAKAFWDSISGKVKSLIRKETENAMRLQRYDVTTAPNGTVMGVRQPFGNNEIFLPYSQEVASATVGDTVLVAWLGSMSNAKVYYFADGYEGGGVGGEPVHVGPTPPADPSVDIWLDTDEPGQTVVTSVNGMSGAVTMPTFSTQEITLNTSGWTLNQTKCFVNGKYVFAPFCVEGTPSKNKTIATGLPIPKLIGGVSPIMLAGSPPSYIAVNTSGTIYISSAGTGTFIGGVFCYEAE
jgi:hypothetical protein